MVEAGVLCRNRIDLIHAGHGPDKTSPWIWLTTIHIFYPTRAAFLPITDTSHQKPPDGKEDRACRDLLLSADAPTRFRELNALSGGARVHHRCDKANAHDQP